MIPDEQLIKAVRNRNIEEVRSLLSQGASANARGNYSDNNVHYEATALFIAVKKGNTEIVELLLQYGAEIDYGNYTKGKLYLTPLHGAMEENNEEIARLLIAKGVDIHFKDGNGHTPLHFAAWYGQEKFVKLFLDMGADVHTKNVRDWTPLVSSILFALNPQVVRLLLEHGADATEVSISVDYLAERHQSYWDKPELRNKMLENFILLLLYGVDLDKGKEYINTRDKINSKPNLKKCLEEFEKIKAMPYLGKLIEANIKRDKKESAKIIAEYINDEAKGQKLISEFKIIKNQYGTDKQLSFIPKCLFSIIKNIVQDYKREKIDHKVAGNFLQSIGSSEVERAGIQGAEDIGKKLSQHLNVQDMANLALVNKKTYEEPAPLNKLITQLKEIVYDVPRRSLTEAQSEAASAQGQSVA